MLLLTIFIKVVSWTPMDAVSNCILELIFRNERLPPVLNVVHPRPTDWNTVIELIRDALVLKKQFNSPLALISFQEWFYILEAHAKAANQENENELRIVRLISFFLEYYYRILTVLVPSPVSNFLISSDKCQKAI
jgi:hypothetical protein